MSAFGGPNIITDGLVLSLDAGNVKSYPGSGTTWFDKSGNGNNGTLTNGPTFATGSIVFDGVDDYIQLPSLGNYGTNPITYEWVIKSTPNGNFQSIFCNGIDALSHIYIINNGNIRYYNGGIFDTTGLTVNTGVFKVITITKGVSSALIYINGVYQTTLNITSNIGNFNNPQLGVTNTSSYPLNGSIASFKIYNRALTSEEVLQNYNATKARFGL